MSGAGFGLSTALALTTPEMPPSCFELRHVVLELLVFGARDEPNLVAPLPEGRDQLLCAGEWVAVLLELGVEFAVQLVDLLRRLLVFDELLDQ
jgi:hypothetical protein